MKSWDRNNVPISYATGKPKIVIESKNLPVKRKSPVLSNGSLAKVEKAVSASINSIRSKNIEPDLYLWDVYPWLT